jgi:hypothetical protein
MFSKGNQFAAKKGEVRNPRGRPSNGDCLTSLLKAYLKKKHINGVTNKDMIAQALIDAAVRGNLKAIEMVLNYTDGKPKESVDVTSNGQPISKPVFVVADTGTQKAAEAIISEAR